MTFGCRNIPSVKAKVAPSVAWRCCISLGCLACLTPAGLLPSVHAQGGSESAIELVEKADFAKAFQSGDTNVPLLALDWFSGSRSDEYCRVNRTGRVSSARHVINWAIQGGHHVDLDPTKLQSLIQTIEALPEPPKAQPPPERCLFVQGIRRNQWFKGIYDRADVPAEVERLYEITGAYLEWFIPEVKGRQFIHTDYGAYHTSQAQIESFHVARSAPLAVSSGVNGLQVWDLNKHAATPLVFLKNNPKSDFQGPWNPAAISPDGKIVAYASTYATFAIDWKGEKILWETAPLVNFESRGCSTKKIAIGGDHGQYCSLRGREELNDGIWPPVGFRRLWPPVHQPFNFLKRHEMAEL